VTDHAALEAQVVSVKQRIRQASDARARAEHQRELAAASVVQAVQAMKAEFGVASLEEAHQLLAGLEAELAAEAAKVSAALQAAGQ
jgi:hypothetical protein